MILVRKSVDRGHFDHGWLDTRHTISFGRYFDRKQMGFRSLRVINEDRVKPGEGFGTHTHENMAIVTYVLDGVWLTGTAWTDRHERGKRLAMTMKYREYDGETGLNATIKAEPTQLEPFRLEAK